MEISCYVLTGLKVERCVASHSNKPLLLSIEVCHKSSSYFRYWNLNRMESELFGVRMCNPRASPNEVIQLRDIQSTVCDGAEVYRRRTHEAIAQARVDCLSEDCSLLALALTRQSVYSLHNKSG